MTVIPRAWRAAAALAAGAMLAGGCSNTSAAPATAEAAAPTVAVARPTRQTLTSRLELTAEFRPYQQVDVHAKVAGYVKDIRVDVGDRVKAGELIAQLEIPELQQDVLEADAALKRDQEEVTRAQDEIRRAESVYQVSHLAYTRLVGVAKVRANLIAQQEVDDAMSRDRVAQAQLDTAKATLAAAQAQQKMDEAKRSRVETLFEYSRIVAPFAGVVTRRYADVGAMVQAGTSSYTQAMPVVTVAENQRLRLVIPVPESVVPDVKLGGAVDVQVPSLAKTFPGKVARFVGALDRSTRTMDTEIDVENPSLTLMPGMYANASIVLRQAPNALTVPVEALDREGDKVSVLRLTPQHTIERRELAIGLETADAVEVRSGLSDSDLIVTSGRSQLRDGERVESKLQAAPAKAS